MQPQRNLLPARYRRPYRPRRQQGTVNEAPRDQAWPGTLMAFGVIVWLVAFWFLGSRTLIGYSELFRWFALFAFAGNLFPYRFSGLKLGMERGEWFFFNLLAIGPFLFTLGLATNFFVHSEVEYFAVPHRQVPDVHRHWIETGNLPQMKPIDEGSRSDHIGWVEIGIADGIFGYPVITTISPIEPF